MKFKMTFYLVTLYMCLFVTPVAYSQTLKTITEDYNEGKITYQYYEDENSLEWIKHGTFKFVKSLKSEFGTSVGTHSTLITGHFKDGFRDGIWNFLIKEIDFPNRGNSYTTEITSATQTFKDGMPNGIWIVNSNQKARNRYRNVWKPFTSVNNVSAKTIFKNGFATGTTTYVKNGVSKTIFLNNNGFITKNFIVNNPYDNTELYINSYGIMTKNVERSKLHEPVKITNYNIKNIKLTEQLIDNKITDKDSAEEIADNYVVVDLSNVMADLGLRDIFEHDYFLLPSLGGDKTYKGTKSQSNRHYGAYIYVNGETN